MSIEENKKLIEEYPFLKITNYYRDVVENFDSQYEYTWLDDLEPGWRKAFGDILCEELKESLLADECFDEFEFQQIKEKYGSLRLYASNYGENTKNILSKYEELSKYICGHCGKPATKITRGWIYPICDDCIRDINGSYSSIEDFYEFNNYDEVLEEIENIKENYNYDDYWKTVK